MKTIEQAVAELLANSRREGDCLIPQDRREDGGGYFNIYYEGGSEKAHRAVYRMKKGPILFGNQVRHSCHNKRCIEETHLHQGTNRDNINDSLEGGIIPRGERHGRAKLTEDQVREIKKSEDSTIYLGKKYGVSHEAISLIRRGITWTHVR